MLLPALIADLDGTLLDADGAVPAQLAQLRDLLHGIGLQFIPATSRSPHNVQSLFRDGEAQWAICSDGATIVRLGGSAIDVVSELSLQPSRAADILRDLTGCLRGSETIVALFCGSQRDFAVLVKGPGEPRPGLRATFGALVSDGRKVMTATHAEMRAAMHLGGTRAISCFGDAEAVRDVAGEMASRLSDDAKSYLYEETRIAESLCWLDIFSAEVGKEGAIERLAAVSGITPVAMLGNGPNDVAALRAANWSACPADACDAAREAASLVATSAGGAGFVDEMCDLIGNGLVLDGR